ncbi:MAG: hypothetical protein A2177_16530 [Spirochaetes bacterium RBG_13_68_11]|nr:MAG: hypothetical protein A2177_16530 [Spirochaetes bacterium RBG_13_68_11]
MVVAPQEAAHEQHPDGFRGLQAQRDGEVVGDHREIAPAAEQARELEAGGARVQDDGEAQEEAELKEAANF